MDGAFANHTDYSLTLFQALFRGVPATKHATPMELAMRRPTKTARGYDLWCRGIELIATNYLVTPIFHDQFSYNVKQGLPKSPRKSGNAKKLGNNRTENDG